ncbi:hypothetical protein B7C42_05511 [Nocardia cerradoensis]|uniref:Uncharacterized protein n=1 Tax=Nocardia cerradoensis TaxID=85688 RepID=A0A231H0F8_9NOCA|nr:hypothetical protein [Nocardia cerradoensis]OXR42312.1 hypothetical protein B7C42_05511 [Nocardia cerradoensis]
MTVVYATNDEVRQDLSHICASVDIEVEDSAGTLIYGVAADSRKALAQLRTALGPIYRIRTARAGDEESWITFLDTIDRSFTVKIRRQLPA